MLNALRHTSYRFAPGRKAEPFCEFVSSRGLLKSCAVRNREVRSSSTALDLDLIRALEPGDTIYVCTDALPVFAATMLPKISMPFALVSGDSDLSVSLEGLGRDTLRALLDNPYLTRWFAQNLAFSHPKINHLPIGMDYHTVAAKAKHPWGGFEAPLDQEQSLKDIRNGAAAFEEKKPFGYCNWHHSLGNGDRSEVLQLLDCSAIYLEHQRVPRKKSWLKNADFFFTISPFGEGMDCHRTWEALLLGSVPIIPASPLKPMFKRLPVVIVEDWRQLKPTFLAEEKRRILSQRYDFSPLYLDYWRARISGRIPLSRPMMTFSEFLSQS
ncbi:hypothetical protein [Pseudovibrio sp. SPO723]|uniref:hypothetical protein n=1 Tax=Nesiotobacter zosterae TaxID=392721 RepID=UPI0029C24C24|nr:hypothetical protein [Pseudovibrio sp. SPO723]MDX5592252.1 hypothetical protein [Pseudovibrio sp. SPO723]